MGNSFKVLQKTFICTEYVPGNGLPVNEERPRLLRAFPHNTKKIFVQLKQNTGIILRNLVMFQSIAKKSPIKKTGLEKKQHYTKWHILGCVEPNNLFILLRLRGFKSL